MGAVTSRSSLVRAGLVLSAFLVVWLALLWWAPTWLAAAAGVVAAALVVAGFQRFGPRAIERALGTSAIRVTLEPDNGRLSDGWSLFLDSDLPEAGRPEGVDSLTAREWVVARGGADSGETYLRLVLEGQSTATVRIRDVRAVILRRGKPLSAASIRSPSAGESESGLLGFNLDEENPIARKVDPRPPYERGDEPQFQDPYFSSRQATLEGGEIVTYTIVAGTTRDYVEWAIEVDMVVDGQEQLVRLDNNGSLFRTSPEAETKREWEWAWYEPPQTRFVDVTVRNREWRAQEDEGARADGPDDSRSGPLAG